MATPPTAVAPAGPPRSRILLIVGGVIVLLALVWFFFLRGGGEEVEDEPIVRSPALEEEAEEEEAEGGRRGPRRGPVETFEIFAPKDPFRPLITAAAGGGTAPAGPTDGGGGQPGDGTGPGGDGDGDGGVPGGGGDSIGGHTVGLIDVFVEDGTRRAQVRIDGTVYTVDEGEVFAESFQLLSTSGECATMLFGDDQFTLCEGEEILK